MIWLVYTALLRENPQLPCRQGNYIPVIDSRAPRLETTLYLTVFNCSPNLEPPAYTNNTVISKISFSQITQRNNLSVKQSLIDSTYSRAQVPFSQVLRSSRLLTILYASCAIRSPSAPYPSVKISGEAGKPIQRPTRYLNQTFDLVDREGASQFPTSRLQSPQPNTTLNN